MGDRQLGEDVPATFEPLAIGNLVRGQTRSPGCLRSDTVKEVGAGLGTTLSTASCVLSPRAVFTYRNASSRPLERVGSFSFELTGDRGAALATRYPTYSEDSLAESTFEKYTKRHYESWVAFVCQKEYGDDVQPVLVSGFDMTRDFAMVAYADSGGSFESDLAIGVPLGFSASAALWGTWRTRQSPHTNYGPQYCVPPPPGQAMDFSSLQLAETPENPSDYNQCVFIRYYTMRTKSRSIPKMIQADTGPYDLGPGDGTGNIFLDMLAQSDAEFALSEDDYLGEEDEDVDFSSGFVIRNTPSVWCLPSALFPL